MVHKVKIPNKHFKIVDFIFQVLKKFISSESYQYLLLASYVIPNTHRRKHLCLSGKLSIYRLATRNLD